MSEISEEKMEELNGYAAKHGGTPLEGLVIQGISAMLESDNTLRLYLYNRAAVAAFGGE